MRESREVVAYFKLKVYVRPNKIIENFVNSKEKFNYKYRSTNKKKLSEYIIPKLYKNYDENIPKGLKKDNRNFNLTKYVAIC